jgi:dihydroorotate dehydrogenase electron transfer subunit
MKKKYQISGQVKSVDSLARDIYRIRVRAPGICRTAKPGQFVFVRVQDQGYDPLLRRAFAVAAVYPGRDDIDIIFNKVGAGTGILARKKTGSNLDITGPLGNHFTLPAKGGRTVLVAGGCGIAPLYFLAATLSRKRTQFHLVYGSSSSCTVALKKELKQICPQVTIVTEDGSEGKKGLVTDVLKNLNNIDCLYACGPDPMLRALLKKLARSHVRAEFSLEPGMACGVGVCQGCIVKTRTASGRIRNSCCCIEGPIYSHGELVWT